MNERFEGISGDQLAGLRRILNCPVLTENDETYGEARRVWNGMIDRKPSAIVRPASIADVIQTVRFAREQQIPVSVKGGGHSVAGKSVADGAMMIDLSTMREIQTNPGRQTALVQGGATWSELTANLKDLSWRLRAASSPQPGFAGLRSAAASAG